LKILISKETNQLEFVNFWSKQYNYSNEYIYDDNIGKKLTEERILKLFQWKNGTPLSVLKLKSVKENYIADTTNFPENPSMDFIRNELLKAGGTIWRIFWIHCHYPKQFPIYDQHVHRAMAHIQGWDSIEIPNYNKKKVDLYLTKYLEFYNEFKGLPHKKVDEALWSYGKFLTQDYSML
jgi:hypothetical protein